MAPSAPRKNDAPHEPICVLNVGTKMLLRDAMDQYLRTLGDVRTYYASNMKHAARHMEEKAIHILICEIFLEDGSAERLIKSLGQRSIQDDLWFVLAIEEKKEEYVTLALELGANSILMKPFAANDLKNQIEKYRNRNQNQVKDAGVDLIKEAEIAMREIRTFDADKKYKEAMVAAPTNPVVQNFAGQHFLRKGEFSFAEQCFKKSLEIKAGYVPAVYGLGQVELARGNLDTAYDLLKEATKISPLFMERALVMAKCHLGKSMESLNRVLSEDEMHPMARLELAKILVVRHDYVGGLNQLERVLPLLSDEALKECQTYMALARKLGSIQKE